MYENVEGLEQVWRVMLEGVQEHWLGSFLLNLIGYGLIILPAALLIRRWKRSQLVQKGMYVLPECGSGVRETMRWVGAYLMREYGTN